MLQFIPCRAYKLNINHVLNLVWDRENINTKKKWTEHLLSCTMTPLFQLSQPCFDILPIAEWTTFTTQKEAAYLKLKWSPNLAWDTACLKQRCTAKNKRVFYLLNSWTLMNENIWVNTLQTKNEGTWKATILFRVLPCSKGNDSTYGTYLKVILTKLALIVFK